jgi:hypothetical protein
MATVLRATVAIARVRSPRPGPISTAASSGSSPETSTIRSVISGERRKF